MNHLLFAIDMKNAGRYLDLNNNLNNYSDDNEAEIPFFASSFCLLFRNNLKA
jgi:hypothetical protein